MYNYQLNLLQQPTLLTPPPPPPMIIFIFQLYSKLEISSIFISPSPPPHYHFTARKKKKNSTYYHHIFYNAGSTTGVLWISFSSLLLLEFLPEFLLDTVDEVPAATNSAKVDGIFHCRSPTNSVISC
jgi:hypothetical protein